MCFLGDKNIIACIVQNMSLIYTKNTHQNYVEQYRTLFCQKEDCYSRSNIPNEIDLSARFTYETLGKYEFCEGSDTYAQQKVC